jgi:SpoVK/Ycf46/Vps4 family AAA+-type ATPase
LSGFRKIADAAVDLAKDMGHAAATEWHVAIAYVTLTEIGKGQAKQQIIDKCEAFLKAFVKNGDGVNLQLTPEAFSLLNNLRERSRALVILEEIFGPLDFGSDDAHPENDNEPDDPNHLDPETPEKKNEDRKGKTSGKSARAKSREATLKEALEELETLVGLPEVKQAVLTWVNQCTVAQHFEAQGLPNLLKDKWMTFAFLGSPGTGKTTVARIIANLFFGLGFTSEPKLVEVTRAQLVGKYIGQTAPQVLDACKKADGGVLFIDEAYSLFNSSENDFGHEAVAELLVQINNRKKSMAVVIAGYKTEMEKFLDSNPGLDSRFPQENRIIFSDYSADSLIELTKVYASGFGIDISDMAMPKILNYFEVARTRKNFGNARDAMSLVTSMYANLCNRAVVGGAIRQDMQFEFTVEDVPNPPLGPQQPRKNPIGFQP